MCLLYEGKKIRRRWKMKRRIMSVCFALLLMTNMLLISTINVEASSDDPILDGSYLTHDEESIGYDTKITRGED